MGLKYCHKKLIHWDVDSTEKKDELIVAFSADKKQLFQLLDLYMQCPGGLTESVNVLFHLILSEKWNKSHFFFVVTLIPYYHAAVAKKGYDKFFKEFQNIKNSNEPVVSFTCVMHNIFISI